MLVSGSDDESAADAMESWRRQMPPDNEVAATVAVDAVVTRNDDVAITLRSLRVLSNGVLLSFVVQHRVDHDPGASGHQPFPVDSDVLVGVELSDGSTATSFQGGAFGGLELGAPGKPVLQQHGGGGGGRMYEMAYWLVPVPPGDLVVVVASVTLDLPEGRVVVPGEVMAEAVGRVRALWPREPDRQFHQEAAVPPDVPAGGWFARVVDAG